MRRMTLLFLCFLFCLNLFGCSSPNQEETTLPAETQAPTVPDVTEPAPTEPTQASTEPEPTDPPTSPVIDLLIELYEPDGSVTPVDYERMTYLPIEELNDLITWTVDADENVVRLVPNETETITVDINELCPEETSYTLTASVVNADGIRVYHSWVYTVPQARDMAQILDEAYALSAREQLPYYSTLTGKVVSIDKPWSEDYQSVTLIMKVESAGNRSVRCYGLVGKDTEAIQIGDVITVTGVLQKYGSIVEFDSGCKLQNITKEN